MNKKFKVIISAKKAGKNGAVDKTIDLVQGEVMHIVAKGGERFQLQEAAATLSPKKVLIKRVGSHLFIVLEGSAEADIIIDNYFDDTLPSNSFEGVAEDGSVFEYTVNETKDSIAQDTAVEAGGAASSGAGFVDAISDYAWAIGIGLAAGGAAAAMGMGGSSKKTSKGSSSSSSSSSSNAGSTTTPKGTPSTPKKAPVINNNVEDDTGSSQSDGVTSNHQPSIQTVPKSSTDKSREASSLGMPILMP